jgi:hypothetical protein
MATTSSGFTAAVGLAAEELLHRFCTSGMRVEPPTSTTSWMSAGLLARVRGRAHRPRSSAHHGLDHLLELGPREADVHVQRGVVARHRHVREVDRGLLRRGELDLGLLRGVADALEGHLVLGEVDAVLLA